MGSADVLEGLALPQPNRPRYRKVKSGLHGGDKGGPANVLNLKVKHGNMV